MREFRLFTALTPEQIVSRLEQKVEGSLFFEQFSSKPLAGRINVEQLVLFKRTAYNNSSRKGLYAHLKPATVEGMNGTLIQGHFRLPTHVVVFNWLWFGLIFVSVLSLTIQMISNRCFDFQMLFPFALIVTIAAVVSKIGDYIARNDPQFMLEFLEQTLQAHPIHESQVR